MSLNFNTLKNSMQNLLSLGKPAQSLAQSLGTLDSGRLYHYVRENEHEKSRIHLRLDEDGTGTLIVNANSIMHLNPTAAFMAWMILERKTKEESIQILSPQNIW